MSTVPAGFRGSFHTDFPIRSAYSEGAGPYRIIPRAVAVPINVEDVCVLVRHAVREGETLTPRGAGSGNTPGRWHVGLEEVAPTSRGACAMVHGGIQFATR